jgi:8-oxo-dGTP pyrophosphatase MutT (NUDIX family)
MFMVQPRNASTVILLRPDEAGGFEILLTRRPETMRFLGGFYVFPGGTVHRDDYSPAMLQRCRQLTGVQARQILGSHYEADEAIGHWVAVARELFEEVGILLGVHASGEAYHPGDEDGWRRLEQKRQAIVKKQLDFAGFLESEDLYCDLSQMVYFDHWVTPDIYSMRFDTRFYVAVLPSGQTSLTRSEEVTHSLWIKPADALARMNRRDFPILPPTTTVLSEFSRFLSWEHLSAEFKFSRLGRAILPC